MFSLRRISIFSIWILYLSIVCFITNTQQMGASARISCNNGPYNGTTKNMKEIFIGRCYYFLNIQQKDNCDFSGKTYDCNKIWDTFYSISRRNSCLVENYDPLFTLTDHPIPENRSLFWSGTYTPAHQFTKTYKYWSLEDTLNGFLLDEINFCNNGTDYIEGNYCPYDCTFRTFWYAASRKFAQKARGSVFLVLNGSRPIGAISPTSTFVLEELPQFNSNNIKKVSVLLLHNIGGAKVETCTNGTTLLQLKQNITSRGIQFECDDTPRSIAFYLCFEDPLSRECENVKFSLDNCDILSRNSLLLILSLLIFYLFT